MPTKRIIYTLLLIIWMIVIFMFSNETGKTSKTTSDKITRTTINVVTDVTNKKITKKEEDKIVKNTRLIVRKLAHFTLYFILGVLVYLTFRSYGISKNIIIYSIGFCLIYAISDEIHQLYTNGRSFKILDILIDTFGSVTSIFIIKLKK